MDIQVKKAKQITDMVSDEAEQLTDSVSKKRFGSSSVVVAMLTVLLVAAIGFGVFSYSKYRSVSNDPKAAINQKNKAETQRVVDGLKKRLFITETEAPTVARVEEPEKLKASNTEFYKDIIKGDYLIIYPKRAIVYRESNDQIINIAPIINTADLKAKDGTTPAATTVKK